MHEHKVLNDIVHHFHQVFDFKGTLKQLYWAIIDDNT